jgi:tRNA 2-selenouridine synthase
MLLSPRALFPDGAGTPARQLIDARAPIEVARGALPFTHALPLMTDEERKRVGIRYKQAGPEAAMELGYELVGPDLERRTEAWRAVADRGPTAVTCWRGGLRSKLVVEFIGRSDVARVEGGYKALRADLLE